jgi:hypothetical protein
MDWSKIKLGFWSATGGAVVLAIVGFNWGGWVTRGTAEARGKEIASNAVAERLGSICVAQFNHDSDKSARLKEMKGKDPWENARYIETQPWAIMPGEDKADSKVADSCAKLLAANQPRIAIAGPSN